MSTFQAMTNGTRMRSMPSAQPTQEGGSPVANAELEAGSLTMQVGEEGAQIRLTQETEIIATFIRLEAAELNLGGDQNPNSPEEFYKKVTKNDRWMRMTTNTKAENKLVENYDEGREKTLKGAAKIAGTVIVVGVIVGLTLATGGAAGAALTTPLMLATYGTAAVVVTVADSNIGEGIDSMNNATNGNLDRGFNYIRDTIFGGDDKAFQIFSAAADIVFGIVSGKAMGSISGVAQIGRFTCGSSELRKAKAAYQIASNVVHAANNQLISTGKLDPYGLAVGVGTGLVQGYLGSSITNGLLSCLGMQDMKLLEALIGTGVDVGLDALMSALAGTDFDFWDSMAQNGFANFLAAYISDPVDAVTGAYLIRSTDFILASLPSAFKLERTYYSTQKTDSVFGRGWSFPYASRIFRNTQDTENLPGTRRMP